MTAAANMANRDGERLSAIGNSQRACLRVSRCAHPITSLGPGRRCVLWVQGCSRRCFGCASPEMQDFAGGTVEDVRELAVRVADCIIEENLDGLSLSGGEPADQGDALACLVEAVRRRLHEARYVPTPGESGQRCGFNVLVFSGCTREELVEKAPQLASCVDVAVCGPYEEAIPRTGRLLASGNQELVVFNQEFRTIYKTYNNLGDKPVSVQVHVDGNRLEMVGLPDSGDYRRIVEELEKRGVKMGGASWRR